MTLIQTVLKGLTIPARKSCLPDIGKSQERIKKSGDSLQCLVGTFWKRNLRLLMLVILKKYIINLHTNYTGQQPLLKFVPHYLVANSFVIKCFNTGLSNCHGSVASWEYPIDGAWTVGPFHERDSLTLKKWLYVCVERLMTGNTPIQFISGLIIAYPLNDVYN
jgi:hypothetical protein